MAPSCTKNRYDPSSWPSSLASRVMIGVAPADTTVSNVTPSIDVVVVVCVSRDWAFVTTSTLVAGVCDATLAMVPVVTETVMSKPQERPVLLVSHVHHTFQ